MAAQTYYELLGVSYDADEQEIWRAYHQKIKEQHPDQNPNDPRAIRHPRRLNEARETLTNKESPVIGILIDSIQRNRITAVAKMAEFHCFN